MTQLFQGFTIKRRGCQEGGGTNLLHLFDRHCSHRRPQDLGDPGRYVNSTLLGKEREDPRHPGISKLDLQTCCIQKHYDTLANILMALTTCLRKLYTISYLRHRPGSSKGIGCRENSTWTICMEKSDSPLESTERPDNQPLATEPQEDYDN